MILTIAPNASPRPSGGILDRRQHVVVTVGSCITTMVVQDRVVALSGVGAGDAVLLGGADSGEVAPALVLVAEGDGGRGVGALDHFDEVAGGVVGELLVVAL